MKLFEGKTKAERNKTIAAIILGGACLIVLFYAFGWNMFGGAKTTATAKPSPTPRNPGTSRSNAAKVEMPSLEEQNFAGATTPIVYSGSNFRADPPGRNIFAFYEPPKPTPYVPTPVPPTPAPPPPSPPAPPPIQMAAINPGSVYAGSNGFRIDIAGDRFTPDTKIYFDQQELPSRFISEQRMTADIPAPLIRGEGRKQILAQTADGTKISNPVMLDVQPPPKPGFQYIGMIARRGGNNDTAYFQESGKPLPTSARLNDVVGGRFRVISISSSETVFEDVSLGFKHKIALAVPSATTTTTGPGGVPGRGVQPGRGTFPSDGGYPQSMPPGYPATNTRIPGIPDNIPRYIPPGSNTNRMPANTKPGRDDDDDDGDGR